MPNQTAQEFLWDAVRARAEARGWTCDETPPGLRMSRFPAEQLLRAGNPEAGPYTDRPAALLAGSFIVRVIGLDSAPSDVNAILSAVNLQASLDHAYLPDAADDLHVFFAAPLGAVGPDWDRFAGHAERDDRVCRKLVWIPAAGAEGAMSASLDAFLARSFLAEPWRHGPADGEARELDPVQRVLAALDLKDLPPRDVVERWLQVLAEGQDESILSVLFGREER